MKSDENGKKEQAPNVEEQISFLRLFSFLH